VHVFVYLFTKILSVEVTDRVYIFIPPSSTIGSRGIMYSGCLSVRPSLRFYRAAWNADSV